MLAILSFMPWILPCNVIIRFWLARIDQVVSSVYPSEWLWTHAVVDVGKCFGTCGGLWVGSVVHVLRCLVHYHGASCHYIASAANWTDAVWRFPTGCESLPNCFSAFLHVPTYFAVQLFLQKWYWRQLRKSYTITMPCCGNRHCNIFQNTTKELICAINSRRTHRQDLADKLKRVCLTKVTAFFVMEFV